MVKFYLGATFVASAIAIASFANGMAALGYAATIFSVGVLLIGASWEDKYYY